MLLEISPENWDHLALLRVVLLELELHSEGKSPAEIIKGIKQAGNLLAQITGNIIDNNPHMPNYGPGALPAPSITPVQDIA